MASGRELLESFPRVSLGIGDCQPAQHLGEQHRVSEQCRVDFRQLWRNAAPALASCSACARIVDRAARRLVPHTARVLARHLAAPPPVELRTVTPADAREQLALA
jgi:hypothetical protein